jgi:UDP-GlcNAc3NAcA epimerase
MGRRQPTFDAMKTVLTIVGARPQFIKSRAFSDAVAADPSLGLQELLLHTGQHHDEAMSGRFFAELGLRTPDVQLTVPPGGHGARTARMLEGIEAVILDRRPDAVLVYGDTDSTLAGALAAAKLNVPVAHVEAGLRSGDRTMPEEVNRILTDHASTWCYTTSSVATDQLAREGVGGEAVIEVGDVMYDVALGAAKSAEAPNAKSKNAPLVVVTLHRPFNADHPNRMAAILENLASAAMAGSPEPWRVLFPMHPRTSSNLERAWGAGWRDMIPAPIEVVEPMGYLDLQAALREASLVFTDSGGLQKEAFFAGAPCVVMRPSTEWTELVDCGAAVLCAEPGPGLRKALQSQMTLDLLTVVPAGVMLYGGGRAGRRIAEHLGQVL